MEVLEKLRDKLSIEAEDYNGINKAIKEFEAEINSQGIEFDEELRLGFYSHMVSFLRRLKKDELLEDEANETIASQIGEENIKISKSLVESLFEKYNIGYNETEMLLIGIYIKMGRNNK